MKTKTSKTSILDIKAGWNTLQQMRAVVQRASEASVSVEGQPGASIGHGLLILLGVETEDTQEDAVWLASKIAQLRIFNDEKDVMNLSVQDVQGRAIVVSQFTLHASTKKGTRPSYHRAAKPETAVPLYEFFVQELSNHLNQPVQTGKFGAHMEVKLTNDGPVTIFIDTKQRD